MGMSIIKKSRRQKAVWWSTPTVDGFGGKQVNLPVEIDCRWEDVMTQIRTANNEEITSTATVYVDRDMTDGGFLKLGTLASLTDLGVDPQHLSGAFEIRKFGKLPVLRVRQDGLDPDANEYLRTAWL